MSAKKAAAKKKAPPAKRSWPRKLHAANAAPGRPSPSPFTSRPQKQGSQPSARAAKKVSIKLAAPKVQPKPSGKKTIATAPKKPGPAPGDARIARRRNPSPAARRSATAQRRQRPQRSGKGVHALSAEARRGVHEQGSARAFPAAPAGLEARAHGGSRSHDAAHEGRCGELPRSERSRDAGVGVRSRAAHSR